MIVNQGDSPEIKARIRIARDRVTSRMEMMFAPEFASLPAQERLQMLIALEALTDVESWARMREFFGLSFDDACLVWTQTIGRLLPKGAGGVA